ncbi:MAG: hypothetical protein IJ305_08340 [Oscillospiraceae bacterium]|nr:hypothetical protein [Oscillospiraceae bacterium]
MNTFIVTLEKMTIMASIAAIAVMLIRFLLRGAPKKWSYILWAAVLFRCLCPFGIESELSLYNVFDKPDLYEAPAESIVHQVEDSTVAEPVYVSPNSPTTEHAEESSRIDTNIIWSAIWLTGFAALGLYGVISSIALSKKLETAIKTEKGIYESDRIVTAFAMGIIPKIYIPKNLPDNERGLIILHERIHIRRFDHITKLLAFIALCVHWFNPIIWLAYVLYNKDMEMSCDEAVLKMCGEKTSYSEALLHTSMRRSGLPVPLAFGETSVKERVKNVIKFKKPKLIISVVSAIAVLTACVILCTNPLGEAVVSADTASSVPITHYDFRFKEHDIYCSTNGGYLMSDEEGLYTVHYLTDSKYIINVYGGKNIYESNNIKINGCDIKSVTINDVYLEKENGLSFIVLNFRLSYDGIMDMSFTDDDGQSSFIGGGNKDCHDVSARIYIADDSWKSIGFTGFDDVPFFVSEELNMEYVMTEYDKALDVVIAEPLPQNPVNGFSMLEDIGEKISPDAVKTNDDFFPTDNMYMLASDDGHWEKIAYGNGQTIILSNRNKDGFSFSENKNAVINIVPDLTPEYSYIGGESLTVGYICNNTAVELYSGKVTENGLSVPFTAHKAGKYRFYICNACAGLQNYSLVSVES